MFVVGEYRLQGRGLFVCNHGIGVKILFFGCKGKNGAVIELLDGCTLVECEVVLLWWFTGYRCCVS